ncbi:MAG: hypothetical protein ACN4GW_04085 [Desulforhopalus sp.]
MKKTAVQHLFPTRGIRILFLTAICSFLLLFFPSQDFALGLTNPTTKNLMFPDVDIAIGKPDVVEVDSPRLEITHAHFICNEMHCGHFHEHCALEVFYSLGPLQTAGGPVKPEVRCKARVCYHTAAGDTLFSEADSDLSDSDKPFSMAEGNSVIIDFHFSFYETVVKAQLDHIECRIHRPEKRALPDKIYHLPSFSNASTIENQAGR